MTHRELLTTVTENLTAAGIEDAKTDAWRLFEEIGGISRSRFFMEADTEVSEEKTSELLKAAEVRGRHVPLQFITGHQEFYGYDIRVSADTLIPRFDTEVLVDTALSYMRGKSRVDVLDICTGTGCILVAVAAELGKIGTCGDFVGCDISSGAIGLATGNAEINGVNAQFFQGDLYEALNNTEYNNKGFDFILSNPPYIKSEVIPTLSGEVRDFEPMTALDGGDDGLVFYRRIIEKAPEHLCSGGWIFFEIGYDQGLEVSELLKEAGFGEIAVIKDLAGLDRVVCGRKE